MSDSGPHGPLVLIIFQELTGKIYKVLRYDICAITMFSLLFNSYYLKTLMCFLVLFSYYLNTLMCSRVLYSYYLNVFMFSLVLIGII